VSRLCELDDHSVSQAVGIPTTLQCNDVTHAQSMRYVGRAVGIEIASLTSKPHRVMALPAASRLN
jgi:hypothetical protein